MKMQIACIIALTALSCTSGDRTEAAQVAETMDRFRKAPNAGKPDMLAPLRKASCSATDVCQARDACLASADATSRSLVLKNEVEQALVQLDAGTLSRDSLEAQGLAAKLDESQKLLDEGFRLLPACDDQVIALKRKYRF